MAIWTDKNFVEEETSDIDENSFKAEADQLPPSTTRSRQTFRQAGSAVVTDAIGNKTGKKTSKTATPAVRSRVVLRDARGYEPPRGRSRTMRASINSLRQYSQPPSLAQSGTAALSATVDPFCVCGTTTNPSPESFIRCAFLDRGCPQPFFHLPCVGLVDHLPQRLEWACPTCRDTRRRSVPSARRKNGIYAPNPILEAVVQLCDSETQADVRASMLGTWVDRREEANALLGATQAAYDGDDGGDDEGQGDKWEGDGMPEDQGNGQSDPDPGEESDKEPEEAGDDSGINKSSGEEDEDHSDDEDDSDDENPDRRDGLAMAAAHGTEGKADIRPNK